MFEPEAPDNPEDSEDELPESKIAKLTFHKFRHE